MKPVIGINVDMTNGPPRVATVQNGYFDAVLKTGGIPVLIPPMPEQDVRSLLDRLDGVMFIGGSDYCPSLYGEEASPKTQLCDDQRISFDYLLIKQAVDTTRMPVLGICAGCQLLNIGLGGSLIQDIPDTLPDSRVQHSTTSGWQRGWHKHEVEFLPNTKLSRIYGLTSLAVPTSHHQAVKEPGKGLVVSAKTEDNIIEAVELPDRPFVIGVQWHPERDFEGNKSLFEEFIRHAAQSRNGSN